jgi:hypothetical protein
MRMPTVSEIESYAQSLSYPTGRVRVSFRGRTVTIKTPQSKVAGPYDMGRRFFQEGSYVRYSDYTVRITYA